MKTVSKKDLTNVVGGLRYTGGPVPAPTRWTYVTI
ncbi:MAG: bacteriocin [Planctomycetaceae bacterium]|nr:bacteriocin [Planctomycetaceae bacterium]